MINLLPQSAQKELQGQYRGHLVIIILWLILLATFLSLVMLVPSYIIFASRSQTLSASLSNEDKDSVAMEQITKSLATLADIGENVRKLAPTEEFSMADLFSHLSATSTPGIVLSSLQYTRGQTLLLSGKAKDRESLRAFVIWLQADKMFSKVDSPISNLLGGKDIPLSIILTLRAKS
ncbi:hypothetical protein A3A21_03220 [Candidatus Jorgensenbacteria bacterium RIFCSPLOWO2_01_FULL_45_25b]|uniref:Uncharacterized protein n=1 Tax=Candidatus Jorgensenbacteria bacterium RIFCSPLOWO2_01_FULL_45_25b TaxID=1798471 RepID=A0A1F6BU04_9BACT|nr:MAG: hypothetical protein A3A21_03220 [Candidatus Jorgensenbacteria bacterium RIFCSPLOWO2_01_FULL_45_25b]